MENLLVSNQKFMCALVIRNSVMRLVKLTLIIVEQGKISIIQFHGNVFPGTPSILYNFVWISYFHAIIISTSNNSVTEYTIKL